MNRKFPVKTRGLIVVFMLHAIFFLSCRPETNADLLIHNATVYTVTGPIIKNGAIVISQGKIVDVGDSKTVMENWDGKVAEIHNAAGNFLMPGFIEGHGHFSAFGFNLINVDLMETKSWSDVVDSVANRVKSAQPGEWILGRGWHQEKWVTSPDQQIQGYPYHDLLSRISPHNPVMLSHASGHALFANEAAMKISGVSAETPDPKGGHIVRDPSGRAIGVFEERAMDVIRDAYQAYQEKMDPSVKNKAWQLAIQKAQRECLKFGITTFQDAGSGFEEISKYRSLARKDSLLIRLWVMLRHPYQELEGHMDGFPIISDEGGHFTCRAIKSEVDGALGSYGAWLLDPYDDKPGFVGQNTTPTEDVQRIAELAIQHRMQLCVHSIGDKANQVTLDIFERTFQKYPDQKDLRWRIEHAQHLDPEDIPRFAELGVIASVQGIHCTSDAPFVEKRLGVERAKNGSYPWRSLLSACAKIANGTDTPVERINPFENLYASVTRKRTDTDQEFYPEQSMTREEALYSLTMGNAYAAFEEKTKGSIEIGKLADLILVSNHLLECTDETLLSTRVLLTIVGGEILYEGNN